MVLPDYEMLLRPNSINLALIKLANLDYSAILHKGKVQFYKQESQERTLFDVTRNEAIAGRAIQGEYELAYGIPDIHRKEKATEAEKAQGREFLKPEHELYQKYKTSDKPGPSTRDAKLEEFSISHNMKVLKAIPRPLKEIAKEILQILGQYVNASEFKLPLNHPIIKYFEFVKNETLRIFSLAKGDDFSGVEGELAKLSRLVQGVHNCKALVIPGKYTVKHGSKAQNEIKFTVDDEGNVHVNGVKSKAPGTRQIESALLENLNKASRYVSAATSKKGIRSHVMQFSNTLENIDLLETTQVINLISELEDPSTSTTSIEHAYHLVDASNNGALVLARGAGALVQSSFYKTVMPALDPQRQITFQNFRDHFSKNTTISQLEHFLTEHLPDAKKMDLEELSRLLCHFIASHLRFSDVHSTNHNLRNFINLMGEIKAYALGLPFMEVYFLRNKSFVTALISQLDAILTVIDANLTDTTDALNSTSNFLESLRAIMEKHLGYYKELLRDLIEVNSHITSITDEDVTRMLKEADEAFDAIVYDIPAQALDDFKFLENVGSPVSPALVQRAELLSTVTLPARFLENQHKRTTPAVMLLSPIEESMDEQPRNLDSSSARISNNNNDDDDENSDLDRDDKKPVAASSRVNSASSSSSSSSGSFSLSASTSTAVSSKKSRQVRAEFTGDELDKIAEEYRTVDGMSAVKQLEANKKSLYQYSLKLEDEREQLEKRLAALNAELEKTKAESTAHSTALETATSTISAARAREEELRNRETMLDSRAQQLQAREGLVTKDQAEVTRVIDNSDVPVNVKEQLKALIQNQPRVGDELFGKIQSVINAVYNIQLLVLRVDLYKNLYVGAATPKLKSMENSFFDTQKNERVAFGEFAKEMKNKLDSFVTFFMDTSKAVLADASKDNKHLSDPYYFALDQLLREITLAAAQVKGNDLTLSGPKGFLGVYFNEIQEVRDSIVSDAVRSRYIEPLSRAEYSLAQLKNLFSEKDVKRFAAIAADTSTQYTQHNPVNVTSAEETSAMEQQWDYSDEENDEVELGPVQQQPAQPAAAAGNNNNNDDDDGPDLNDDNDDEAPQGPNQGT